MWSGITMKFGGKDYTVAPMPLGVFENMQARLQEMTESANPLDPKTIATIIDSLTACMQQNYPDMTRDQCANLVNVANMQDVVLAVMDVNGMRRKAQEAEQAAQGNRIAPSTGANSTQS